MRKELLSVANGLTPSATTLHPLVLRALQPLRPGQAE